jgi:hypothetical protein
LDAEELARNIFNSDSSMFSRMEMQRQDQEALLCGPGVLRGVSGGVAEQRGPVALRLQRLPGVPSLEASTEIGRGTEAVKWATEPAAAGGLGGANLRGGPDAGNISCFTSAYLLLRNPR